MLKLSYYAKKSATRNEAIIQAYGSGGYSMKEIGGYFGLHYSQVSRIVANDRGVKHKIW